MTARFALAVVAVMVCASLGLAAEGTNVTGLWSGEISSPDGSFHAVIFVEVTSAPDGSLTGVVRMDDPTAAGDKADVVTFANHTLRLEMKARNAVIRGELSADGKSLEGSASQGEFSLPLTLYRVEKPQPAAQPAPPKEVGVGGSDFHKNDITYSTEVATPHVKWATKLPGGPIKGFFIPSIQYGRDMVELMQRLDLAPTTVSIDREWDINCWGIGDYYGHEERGDRDDFQVVYGYVEKDLTGPAPFDVIVIPGLNGWSRMTRATRDAILKRVAAGAGLVLIHPFVGDVKGHPFVGDEPEGDTRLWEISPLVDCPDDIVKDDGYWEPNLNALTSGKWERAQSHFITDGIPLELLPEGVNGGRFYKYRATGEVLIKSGQYPILAIKGYGKGRVVALAYLEQGFLPEFVEAATAGITWDYWEYQYALLARCLLWASGKELTVAVDGLQVEPNLVLAALTATAPRRIRVELSGGSGFGVTRVDLTPPGGVVKEIEQGKNLLPIPISGPWSQGRNLVNLIVRDADTGATLDWAAATFALPQQATLADLKLDAPSYRRGEVITGSVRVNGDRSSLVLRFTARDDLGRLIYRHQQPATRAATFTCPLSNFLGRYATLTAELVGGKEELVDQLRATPVYVAPATRRDKEYRASLGFASIRPYFSELRLKLMNAAGVQAGTTWTEGVDNGLDIPHNHFGVYWYRRGPTTPEGLEREIAEYQRTGNFASLSYNAKRELYARTKDKKFLERTPCLDDPAVLKDLYDRVYASAKEKAPFNMDYYFVGDEGSLTSYGDEYDYCWGPHSLAGFREWLKQEYRSLAALNRHWRTDFQDWASVVPLTTEEAVQSGNFAPWADHRTYMEVVFARAYQTCRDAVVAADPDGHIAVSGTQGTTAYNGCDWSRLDQVIDDFLSYGGGNQWDLHRSFAKPGAMIGFWTGYGSSGLSVQNAIWNAALHNVLYPNIFWIYSYFDPDFTYSNSARDMGEAFNDLRFEGVGRLFAESERLQDGIALHFSMPSVHATTIYGKVHADRDDLRSLGGARGGWVQLINDLGMQFDFVSSDQLEKNALAKGKYRALLLPLSVALSPEEVEKIKAFAEGGGIVIADAGAGAMDEHCAWTDGRLNDFFGIKTAPQPERLFARLAGEVKVTPEGETWGLKAEAVKEVDAVEPVTATTGKALLKIGETDAVIVRNVGKGWAIYLNTCPDRYGRGGRRRRTETGPPRPDTSASYRALARALLDHLALQSPLQVRDATGQPLERAQIVRYRFGASEALALLTANLGARAVEGRDGVTVYRDDKLGEVARQEITITLPDTYYVTDARTGERLGHTNTVKTSVIVGGALVLGLAKQTNTLTLTAPEEGSCGDPLTFSLASSRPSKALVRCHVYGPDGSFLPLYSQNLVLEKGAGTFLLPTALNDPAGEYTVKATDVITGATAEAKVMLR